MDDDIERQIMMEMEREIQRNQGPASSNAAPPPFEITPIYTNFSQAQSQEQDELEMKLLRKQQEDRARREAEEEARREAEEQARREAEEEARKQAEEEARREAEEEARREAEEQARREAEEEAQREAEAEKARREAEEEARREAEEEARREAEEEARREAEEEARREAEEEARREAEEKARREAEEEARREAEEEARREAEEEARREAEEEARREAEEEARREAEEEARREAEEEARLAAEQARRQAEEQARRQAEEAARLKAAEQARLIAEEKARKEAEQQARKEAEEQARREAEEEARRQAEEQARREAEEEARRQAEEQARREAEEEARRQAEEQARREAEEEARRQAEEQARREAEEEARRQAEEQARREAEEEARRQAEEQARREAEEEARRQAEEQARREAEEEARRQAEEQARREAEEEARRQAEEQARREAEEEARRQAEEQARREAEEEARRQAEEQARREAEEEARRQAEEQARREAEEQARKEAEEQARREAEAAARKEAEARQRAEALEEIKRKAREAVFREYAAKGKIRAESIPTATAVGAAVPAVATAVATAAVTAAAVSGAASAASAPVTSNRALAQSASSSAASPAIVSPNGAGSTLPAAASAPISKDAAPQSKSNVLNAPQSSSLAASTNDISTLAKPVSLVATEERTSPVSPQSPSPKGEKNTDLMTPEESTLERQSDDDHTETNHEVQLPNRLQKDVTTYTSESSEDSDGDLQSEASRYSISAKEAMTNENGILGGFEGSLPPPDSTADKPMETFEDTLDSELHALGLTQENIQRARVDIQRFDTIREPGKCLGPVEKDTVIPAHAQIQLGFFSAKQTIISLHVERHRTVAERERISSGQQKSLSSLNCYFESEILEDKTLTVDDENCAHNMTSEQLLTKEDIMRADGSAVDKAVSRISYGDPIQVWEKVHGRHLLKDEDKEENRSTRHNMWVSDVETKKPIPAMRTFTGGSVICIEAAKVSSKVDSCHGEGTDPLILAVSLFSVTEQRRTKVTETFYFDTALDIFYPQKERCELAKDNKVVVFIPNEFRGNLYMIIRVYRPCCEDFDNYVDLYTRAEKYKPVHVAPMKQEALLLAQMSDVFEEIGWYALPIDKDRNLEPMVRVNQVYRRLCTDMQLLRLIPDERSRNALKTVPFNFEFKLSDLTKYEVSFPHKEEEPRPEENESMVSLLDPDVPNARPKTYRYSPCCIPILNSGYFTTYNNVYYFRLSRMKVINTGSLRSFPASHHTYAVQICIKGNDDSLTEESAIRCIYGRGLNNLSLDTTAWSSSVHNSTETPLSDEFKIQLPINLTEKHHIFFILHAMYQKKTPPQPNQPNTYRVAYAAFPLMVDGTIQVKDNIEIKFISHDKAAVASAGGYLSSFSKAPLASFLNNGELVLKAATQTKSTVYASNRIIASVFKRSPPSIEEIKRDNDVLAVSGKLKEIQVPAADPHRPIITLIGQLPLAEILAFFPFLCSYAMALIGSSSNTVSLAHRSHMLDTLIEITSKAHQFDTNIHTVKRRHGGVHPGSLITKTSAGSVLYHFLTNDILYEGKAKTHKYRIYAGLAETWLNLLGVLEKRKEAESKAAAPVQPPPPAAKPGSPGSPGTNPSSPSKAPASVEKNERNLAREMWELSWFLYDAILRSLYIWGDENINTKRTDLFDASFYTLIANLCVKILKMLSVYGESVIVRRTAVFAKSLMHYCDRGRVLVVYESIVQYFLDEANFDSLTNFLRYILEDPGSTFLLMPVVGQQEPVFLTKILVKCFSVLLVNKNRETRTNAASVLYNYLSALAIDPKIQGDLLSYIASQLFTLVLHIGPQWKVISHNGEKAAATVALDDRRLQSVIALWIIYYTPRMQIKQWLQAEKDGKVIAGLMSIISDAQVLFRYSAGAEKRLDAVKKEDMELVKIWDARMSTFITAIGTQICNIALCAIPDVLRTVKDDSYNACVFPFFVMLESILNVGNSTIALQMSSAVLHQTVAVLFPEIISKKAKMSSGMVLLTFRLMSSCCQFVRAAAGYTFLFMSQSFYSWKNSLSKIKSLTANALVSVAESKTRDLRLAGRFIEFQFDELIDRAKVEEENFFMPSHDYAARYEDDSNASGGDTQMEYKSIVEEKYENVKRVIPISEYLLQRNASKDKPVFSAEFSAMTATVLSLFDDVLRLQVDSSMKYKESKIFAYFEVFRNFLRQNALKEALKWLYRLHDAHKANGDNAEAGMVLVFISAICFRVTELFYHMKGKNTKGARMPYAILTHVYWQDYVRILPEVDILLPADTVYAIVSELYVCPDDPCFTMEGQVKTMKVAAEFLDKGQYYEFSVAAIHVVDLYMQAQQNYKDSAVIHAATATWCTAISDNAKRDTHTYYLLWARMEREAPPKSRKELQEEEEDGMVGEKPRGLPNGKPLHRVYKMPPDTTLKKFEEYAQGYISTLFSDESLVVLTKDMTETQAALPEPDSKRKRVAAVHRQPNHCLVTVWAVSPYFPGVRSPPEGFDKKMHIKKFTSIIHVGLNEQIIDASKFDIMQQCLNINTYELDRAFPSTTSAIDIVSLKKELLNPFETAEETVNYRKQLIAEAPEDDKLICEIRDALSPMGMPPGAYMKEVIANMNDHSEVIKAVHEFSTFLRAKMEVCGTKLDAMSKHPEDYALALKAATDIECSLIAIETPDVDGDE